MLLDMGILATAYLVFNVIAIPATREQWIILYVALTGQVFSNLFIILHLARSIRAAR